jgi:hypothetical protein
MPVRLLGSLTLWEFSRLSGEAPLVKLNATKRETHGLVFGWGQGPGQGLQTQSTRVAARLV